MIKSSKITWHTEKRQVKDLRPFKGNPRGASEKEYQDLDNSLKKFDLAEPLVINLDNIVIGGNFRLKILHDKAVKTVDVRVPSRMLTAKEAQELNLRLNKNQGHWDLKLLADFNEDILKNIGFEMFELDEIYGSIDDINEDFDIEKELEKILKGKKRRVGDGDIWQLGVHRLIIGNSTNKNTWFKLMRQERFDFLFTDPPYKIGANLGSKKIGHHNYKMKVRTRDGFGYRGQWAYIGLKERGGVPAFDEWLSIAKDYQNEKGVNVMIFENWKNIVELWQAMAKYWKIRNIIIWWLPNRSQGFSSPHRFFSKYDIAPLAGNGSVNQAYEDTLDKYLRERGQKLLDTYEVILYGKEGKSYWDKRKRTHWSRINDHITWSAETSKSSGQSLIFGTKPIQILVPYIKILSPRNGIIVDCFGGSGSTLIACEIMKRQCRMIEVSSIYAEVIINRWENFTKKTATIFTHVK